jgi:hypothetical protein
MSGLSNRSFSYPRYYRAIEDERPSVRFRKNNQNKGIQQNPLPWQNGNLATPAKRGEKFYNSLKI